MRMRRSGEEIPLGDGGVSLVVFGAKYAYKNLCSQNVMIYDTV